MSASTEDSSERFEWVERPVPMFVAGLLFVVFGLGVAVEWAVEIRTLPVAPAVVGAVCGVLTASTNHVPVIGPAIERHDEWLVPFLATLAAFAFVRVESLGVVTASWIGFGAGLLVGAAAVGGVAAVD